MQISLWRRYSYAVSLTAFVVVAATAYASGPDVRTVQLRDDCDPATFDAAVGPGTCVGDGDTTFAEFLGEFLARGSVEKWRFNPDRSDAERGAKAQNRGGELHTFTKVDHFGDGFVELLNAKQGANADPLLECARRTPAGVLIRDEQGNLVPAQAAIDSFVFPNTTSNTTSLAKGVYKFQCCIHPWMHTTLEVR
jgi:hypothetical protein